MADTVDVLLKQDAAEEMSESVTASAGTVDSTCNPYAIQGFSGFAYQIKPAEIVKPETLRIGHVVEILRDFAETKNLQGGDMDQHASLYHDKLKPLLQRLFSPSDISDISPLTMARFLRTEVKRFLGRIKAGECQETEAKSEKMIVSAFLKQCRLAERMQLDKDSAERAKVRAGKKPQQSTRMRSVLTSAKSPVKNGLASSVRARAAQRASAHACPQCPQTFSTRFGLVSHNKVHGRKEKFHCSECSASYASEALLDKHMEVHEDVETSTDTESSEDDMADNIPKPSRHTKTADPSQNEAVSMQPAESPPESVDHLAIAEKSDKPLCDTEDVKRMNPLMVYLLAMSDGCRKLLARSYESASFAAKVPDEKSDETKLVLETFLHVAVSGVVVEMTQRLNMEIATRKSREDLHDTPMLDANEQLLINSPTSTIESAPEGVVEKPIHASFRLTTLHALTEHFMLMHNTCHVMRYSTQETLPMEVLDFLNLLLRDVRQSLSLSTN